MQDMTNTNPHNDNEPVTQEEREKQDRISRISGQPDPSITENTSKTPRELLQEAAQTSLPPTQTDSTSASTTSHPMDDQSIG